jgi:hypothetical protein
VRLLSTLYSRKVCAGALANREERVFYFRLMKFLHALWLAFCCSAVAAGAADFKKDIRPILKAKCYECHSEEKKKEKSGYVFDNLERLANDIGPKGQIVPGDPERSNLLDLVSRTDKNRMPPGGKEGLTAKEIKLLREWIQAGAVLDESKPKSASGLAPRAPEGPPPPIQDWTNTDGKTIKARYVRMSGDAVVIKTADGKSYKVPLAKLSAASQELAKVAAAAEAKEAKAAAP